MINNEKLDFICDDLLDDRFIYETELKYYWDKDGHIYRVLSDLVYLHKPRKRDFRIATDFENYAIIGSQV